MSAATGRGSVASNPNRAGSRPMTVAAWMAGTNSFVSCFRNRLRARVQKSLDPTARMAWTIFNSPAL